MVNKTSSLGAAVGPTARFVIWKLGGGKGMVKFTDMQSSAPVVQSIQSVRPQTTNR
jgi:hypothetical protein